MTPKQITDALLAVTGEESDVTPLTGEVVRVFGVDREVVLALESHPSKAEARLLRELLTESVQPSTIADAVRTEAGRYDPIVAGGYPIREAVLYEKGEVDLADAVLAELGLDELHVAAAVRSELPQIDFTDVIMAKINASSLSTPEAVMVPTPVNSQLSQWGTWVFGIAAIVLFSLLPTAPMNVDSGHTMQFASVTEVSVDALEYAAQTNVQVFHGDEGPLVIWLDEEAVL